MEHIGIHVHIESGDNVNDRAHQCTSLDTNIQRHLHFESSLDEPRSKDDSSGANDGDDDGSEDEDDIDRGILGDWTQDGDFDAGNGGSDFD